MNETPNSAYEYEDNDINLILKLLLEKVVALDSNTNHLLAAIDNVRPGQLKRSLKSFLRETDLSKISVNMNILIPYNLGGYHWVALFLIIDNQHTAQQAFYCDPLGNSEIPNYLIKDLRSLWPDLKIENKILLVQSDSTSCGAVMIENLRLILTITERQQRLLSEEITDIRRQHLNIIEKYAPAQYNSFYQRQRENRPTVPDLPTQLAWLTQGVKFSPVEYHRIIQAGSLYNKIIEPAIKERLLAALADNPSYTNQVQLHIKAIRDTFIASFGMRLVDEDKRTLHQIMGLFYGVEPEEISTLDINIADFRITHEELKHIYELIKQPMHIVINNDCQEKLVSAEQMLSDPNASLAYDQKLENTDKSITYKSQTAMEVLDAIPAFNQQCQLIRDRLIVLHNIILSLIDNNKFEMINPILQKLHKNKFVFNLKKNSIAVWESYAIYITTNAEAIAHYIQLLYRDSQTVAGDISALLSATAAMRDIVNIRKNLANFTLEERNLIYENFSTNQTTHASGHSVRKEQKRLNLLRAKRFDLFLRDIWEYILTAEEEAGSPSRMIFISYAWTINKVSEGWVMPFLKHLAIHLAKIGQRALLDRLHSGEANRLDGFMAKISESSDYILVVSSEAMGIKINMKDASGAKFEHSHIQKHLAAIEDKSDFIIPILLSPDNKLHDDLQDVPSLSFLEVYCDAFKLLIHRIIRFRDPETFNKIWAQKLRERQVLNNLHDVPPPYAFFCKKTGVLESVHEVLNMHAMVQLCGPKGCGKTTLALAYAHQHKHDYDQVYWVNKDGLEFYRSHFYEIAQSGTCSLIILDDISEVEIKRFFQIMKETQSESRILITRIKPLQRIERIEIKAFTEEEGKRLVSMILSSEALNDESDVIRQLIALFKEDPNAITLACGFIQRCQISIKKYLELYRAAPSHQDRLKLMPRDMQEEAPHIESVANLAILEGKTNELLAALSCDFAPVKDYFIKLEQFIVKFIGLNLSANINKLLQQLIISCNNNYQIISKRNEITSLLCIKYVISHLESILYLPEVMVIDNTLRWDINEIINQGSQIIRLHLNLIKHLLDIRKIDKPETESHDQLIRIDKENDVVAEQKRRIEQYEFNKDVEVNTFLRSIWLYALDVLKEGRLFRSKKVYVSNFNVENDQSISINTLCHHLQEVGIQIYRDIKEIESCDIILVISSQNRASDKIAQIVQKEDDLILQHFGESDKRCIIQVLLNKVNYCDKRYSKLVAGSFCIDPYLKALRSLVASIYGFDLVTFNQYWKEKLKALKLIKTNDLLVGVPSRNQNFVGRKEILGMISLHFESAKSSPLALVACHGTAGIGKSSIALEFCYDQAYLYPEGIFWINAEDEKSLISDFISIGEAKKLFKDNETINPSEKVTRVKEYLARNHEWLIVFDNACGGTREDSFIKDYLLQGGDVIVTSRETKWDGFNSLPIGVFSPAEAKAFMVKLLGNEKIILESAEADELAALLEYLPLALLHACTYINYQKISIRKYLAEYQENFLQTQSVMASTLTSTFKAIEKEDQEALEHLIFLTRVSFGTFSPIPLLHSVLNDVYNNPTLSEIRLHQLLRLFSEYSIITLEKNNDVMTLHRVVFQTIQSRKLKVKSFETNSILMVYAKYMPFAYQSWMFIDCYKMALILKNHISCLNVIFKEICLPERSTETETVVLRREIAVEIMAMGYEVPTKIKTTTIRKLYLHLFDVMASTSPTTTTQIANYTKISIVGALLLNELKHLPFFIGKLQAYQGNNDLSTIKLLEFVYRQITEKIKIVSNPPPTTFLGSAYANIKEKIISSKHTLIKALRTIIKQYENGVDEDNLFDYLIDFAIVNLVKQTSSVIFESIPVADTDKFLNLLRELVFDDNKRFPTLKKKLNFLNRYTTNIFTDHMTRYYEEPIGSNNDPTPNKQLTPTSSLHHIPELSQLKSVTNGIQECAAIFYQVLISGNCEEHLEKMQLLFVKNTMIYDAFIAPSVQIIALSISLFQKLHTLSFSEEDPKEMAETGKMLCKKMSEKLTKAYGSDHLVVQEMPSMLTFVNDPNDDFTPVIKALSHLLLPRQNLTKIHVGLKYLFNNLSYLKYLYLLKYLPGILTLAHELPKGNMEVEEILAKIFSTFAPIFKQIFELIQDLGLEEDFIILIINVINKMNHDASTLRRIGIFVFEHLKPNKFFTSSHHLDLAQLYQAENNMTMAETEFKISLEMDSSEMMKHCYGYFLTTQNRFAEADQLFNVSLELILPTISVRKILSPIYDYYFQAELTHFGNFELPVSLLYLYRCIQHAYASERDSYYLRFIQHACTQLPSPLTTRLIVYIFANTTQPEIAQLREKIESELFANNHNKHIYKNHDYLNEMIILIECWQQIVNIDPNGFFKHASPSDIAYIFVKLLKMRSLITAASNALDDDFSSDAVDHTMRRIIEAQLYAHYFYILYFEAIERHYECRNMVDQFAVLAELNPSSIAGLILSQLPNEPLDYEKTAMASLTDTTVTAAASFFPTIEQASTHPYVDVVNTDSEPTQDAYHLAIELAKAISLEIPTNLSTNSLFNLKPYTDNDINILLKQAIPQDDTIILPAYIFNIAQEKDSLLNIFNELPVLFNRIIIPLYMQHSKQWLSLVISHSEHSQSVTIINPICDELGIRDEDIEITYIQSAELIELIGESNNMLYRPLLEIINNCHQFQNMERRLIHCQLAVTNSVTGAWLALAVRHSGSPSNLCALRQMSISDLLQKNRQILASESTKTSEKTPENTRHASL